MITSRSVEGHELSGQIRSSISRKYTFVRPLAAARSAANAASLSAADASKSQGWRLTTPRATQPGTSNGGSGDPVIPGTVQEISGPLQLCSEKALHATLAPEKWQGERLWLVALHGEIAMEDDKVGALRREIICEVVP